MIRTHRLPPGLLLLALTLPAGCSSGPSGSPDAGTSGLDAGAPDLAPRVYRRAPARADWSYGWDPTGKQLYAWGGDDGKVVSTTLLPRYHDDLWIFDEATGGWTSSSATGPSPRGRTAFAMDTTDRRLVVGLGRARSPNAAPSVPFNLPTDTWAYDVAGDQWTQLAATGTPPGRHGVVSVFDAARDRMVVFGGDLSTAVDIFGHQATDETWQLDLSAVASGSAAWSQVNTNGQPPPARYLASAALDTKHNRMIVVGGVDEQGTFFNDAWALDLATDTWTELMPDTSTAEPSQRIGGAAAYDAASDRVIVFAGHDLSELGHVNDTYALTLGASPAWVSLGTGDVPDDTTLGCAGNATEQGYHFTVPDLSSPERRERALFVDAGDRLILQGGEGDCSQLDDTWYFQGGTWDLAIPATKGESCLRRGDDCPCLCF